MPAVDGRRPVDEHAWYADRGRQMHWTSVVRHDGGRAREERAKHPDRIGVVVYERLLSGDRAQLDALCDWLGAGPPDDWMSSYYSQITEGWANRRARPLTLTPAERELVERTARYDLRVKLLELALS